jgi:hypothetical protein
MNITNSNIEYDIIEQYEYVVVENDENIKFKIYDIIEDNEKFSVMVIKNSDEIIPLNENSNKNTNTNLLKIPTNFTHPLRQEPIIPSLYEKVPWICVPYNILSKEYQTITDKPTFPKFKSIKNGYVTVPEEWIYYEGNPAFITNEILKIFS